MALTKVTGDFIKAGSITQGHLHSSHGITTTHITEGDKLFFTNARVDSRVGSLSTSNLSEGTNLYYTDARVDARIAAADTGDLSEGTNLYYTQARFNTAFTAKSTSDLSEGTNLYYTDARADARITAADTDSLSEGSTNLYYTDARADARVALIVDSAPGTLNTLNELAAALGDDANFSTTVTNSIATKLPLAGGTLTGNLTVNARGFFNGGGAYPLQTSSTQRYNFQIRNTNNTVNSGYGWWLATDTDFDFALHADGAGDRFTLTRTGNATFTGTITASGYNDANWNTAYGWGDHGAAGYLTSFDITTQTDAKYLRSNADDTASGILTLTKNTATGLANNAFSHAKTVIGGLHFANGNGPAANNGNQAAITFQGGTASEAQAGIYVHNNNSQGTHMLFATTDSYSNGPKAGITLLNNGNVTIRGTVGASNFSGSSSGTNTGDQDLSSYATSATTLAGYGITDAIEKGAQIASGASWTTATRFGSTGDLSQAAGNHALSVRSENNNDAFMSFHIGSDYAVHFGLDGASNRMHVGGWSDGTGTQYQLYDSRDFSVASVLNSNVTLASLGALSTSGKAADSNLLDGKDHTQFGATLATYGTTAGSSGRIRCTAPFNTNSAHMFQIMISLYGSYTQHTYIVSAYMYPSTNQWYSPQAVYLGTGSPDIIVGRDSNGKAYISIANGNYMGVRVHNMTRGYQTSVADTYDPWTITVDAGTENSVTPSIYKTWTSGNDGSGSGLDADLLDGQHASAFQAAGNYAPAGGSYSTDWYVDDLYHDAWVRNHTNNNGHYWDSTGWHLYPKNGSDFYMRSGSSSCALVMTIGNETARGYVYANGSSEVGFLNNTRSWSLRVDNSGHASATGSHRAPIFYDSNDTNSYFDANRLVMRGVDPTIIMRDTNHNSAMMHVNSDRWYVLRGGDDTETWTTTNGHWPLYIELGNNDAYFGRHLYALSSMRAPIFYDRDNTAYAINPASNSHFNTISCAGGFLFGDNYGVGVTGLYSASRIQTIFNMGNSYKLPNDGNSTGNAYGLYWSHPNAGTKGGANNLNDHGLLIINNGSFRAAISSRAVFSSDVRGTLFYDYNNTGYYMDPNSTSNLYHVNVSQVIASDWLRTTGNSGWYSNTHGGGMWMEDSTYVRVYGDKRLYNPNTSHLSIYTAGGVTSTNQMRSPIYYDYNNTAYYTRPSTSSNINSLYTAGLIQAGASGTGNIYVGGQSGNHFRFHTHGGATYFDMNSGTINWRQGSSTRYYFYPSTANMTINGTLTQYSDIRYKENIVEIPDAIDKVKSIRGVYYNRTDFNTEPTKIGVIAQEVEVLMPELILQAEDTDMKSVSYNELTAVLVQAIKEQQTIIDDLKSRIETLENQ